MCRAKAILLHLCCIAVKLARRRAIGFHVEALRRELTRSRGGMKQPKA